MLVEVYNLYSRLSIASDDEKAWVDEYLSFDDASARFRTGGGDGRVRLYNGFAGSFPTGFITLVQKAAADANIKVDLLDRRVAPCTVDASADLQWLRDYQREGLDRIVRRGRGILWHATGAGKTETLIGIMRSLPCRWLFLSNRAGLCDQAANRYELRAKEHGTGEPPAGRIYEGHWSTGERLTCATFQTVYDRLRAGDPTTVELLESAEGLAVDESHVLPSDSFWMVAMATKNAYYRLGLSGTPLARGDRKSLYAIAALGPVIHRVKAETLVNAGVLAKPRVRMAAVQHSTAASTWKGVYSACVVRGAPRNDAVVRAAIAAAKPGLLFFTEIAHGRELVRRLGLAGVNAELVYGAHSIDYRKSLVRRLVAGHFDVLVCSVVFQEGIDIPELRSVGVACGGKSLIGVLQRLGRGMRIDRDPNGNVREGGNEFEVYDILDRGNKWLETHANVRRAAYVNEGFETVVDGMAWKAK